MLSWIKSRILKYKARRKLTKLLKSNNPWCNNYAESILGMPDEVVMEAVARLTNYPTLKDVIQAVAKMSKSLLAIRSLTIADSRAISSLSLGSTSKNKAISLNVG